MPERNQEQLLGYLIGALEDSERAQIEVRLQRDSSLRDELAEAQESLRPLRGARRRYRPPADLAARTCRFVESFAAPPAAEAPAVACAARQAGPRPARRMSTATAPPASEAAWTWVDVAVTTCIVAAMALLLFPAVQRSRINARLLACQDKFRSLGFSLAQANEAHREFLSDVLRPDRQVTASVPPSVLVRGEELEGGRPPWRLPPACQRQPRASIHPGMTLNVWGQNVLFGDGRVAFLVTGPAAGASSPWGFDQEPTRDPHVDPLLVIGTASRPGPIVPASHWGQ